MKRQEFLKLLHVIEDRTDDLKHHIIALCKTQYGNPSDLITKRYLLDNHDKVFTKLATTCMELCIALGQLWQEPACDILEETSSEEPFIDDFAGCE